MERYELTVKERIKWMMRARIMTLMMKTWYTPDGEGHDSADVGEDDDYIS